MTPTAIRTVRTGRLLHITIDRPGRMNALGVDDLVALDTAISGAEATGARAIVLTGAGRAFCTGADLTAVTGEEPEVVMDAANRVIRGIVSAPIPVIAAVNGPAVGYGVALACAADLTYAAESAYFLLSFTSIGLMPDGGATALVAAAIGRARATELALLGQRLSATDAAQTGLVARILPDDQLAAHVEAVAGTLGAGPRRALELTRRALAASTLGHLDHALERERAGQIELIGTPDFAEGADAVLTKRPPHLLSRPPADHRRIMATLGGQLTLNARRHPDRPALIFEGVERSYGQLDREINQYANALLSLGVQKGDRVAVLSPNSDRFLLALYGAFKVGAIVSPFNPRSTARELAYLLEDSGASVLLFGGDTVAAVRDLAKLEQAPAAPALSLDGADGFDDFVQLASSMPDSDPQVEVREDDDCMIIYTSGTTGKPKGALFDHHRLLWVGHAVSSLGVNSFDRNLHVAPMYHCAELVLFVLSGFSMGTTHVVLPAFEPAAVLDALERYRITVFLGVPTMYQMMLTVPDLERRDLSHWRLGFFGAAPMPPTAVAKLVTTFPDVGFFQLCGPTEGGPTGIYSTPDEVAVRPDATGRWPITNAEFRLVDPDGNDVPTGMTGEIILRGETIMKGYWNKPEATAETIRDGWLHTGDLAVRDADGFITIVDRLKDMIITGGRNVYSIEVENALAGHPDVQDVAVVGLDHATFGETIVAIVTPVPGREVTLEELRTYAAEYVADYKLPRDLIVRDIPRNPSGKILKHVLRSEIRDDSAQRT